ncbi:Signal recognition particle [Tritrichomonas musculus]|uniref:signal-recognition-particle GTPase n=1 Tax=Tritrichomonas musculus TaxID=1915356 RepID=A0ABR2HVP3_9EUKA
MLQDLGGKILNSLNNLDTAKQIDNIFFKEFMKEIINALKSADVNQMTILEFFKDMTSKVNFSESPPFISTRKVIEREIINGLVGMIDRNVKQWSPAKDTFNIIMIAGLQGSGKTRICTKLGNFYKKQGFKVGLISTDTLGGGSREQLMQNAQEYDLPYYVDFVTNDPVEIAASGIDKFKKEKFNLIIIDTSTYLQETALFQEIQQFKDSINASQVVLVIDGSVGQVAYSQAKSFSEAICSSSFIISKLDSNEKVFGTLSGVASTNSPILFYETSEDATTLEVFDAKNIISRMLGFGDEKELTKKQQEIIQRKFTFGDMYNQCQIALDNSDTLSLTPDGKSLLGTYKKILVVIDSMNDDEIDDPSLFNEDQSRKNRIAQGTGVSIDFIEFVIDQREKNEEYFERIYRPINPTKIERNPYQMNEKSFQQNLQNIAKSMDPKTLKMIGGVSGLKNIMKKSISACKNKK